MTFTKHDCDKPRLDLLPVRAVEAMGRVLTFGARKYSDDNWRAVESPRRYVAAGLRHVFAYMRGEQCDKETGEHHLAHALCCFAFVLELDEGEAPLTKPATWWAPTQEIQCDE